MPKNPDFRTFGRYQELLVEGMSPRQKKTCEYTMKGRGQVPGPYKIWLQNPKVALAFEGVVNRFDPLHSGSGAPRPADWQRDRSRARRHDRLFRKTAHARFAGHAGDAGIAPRLPLAAARNPGTGCMTIYGWGYPPPKGVSRAVSEITLTGRLPGQPGRLDVAAGMTTVIWPVASGRRSQPMHTWGSGGAR
jgi:hypothetical protein